MTVGCSRNVPATGKSRPCTVLFLFQGDTTGEVNWNNRRFSRKTSGAFTKSQKKLGSCNNASTSFAWPRPPAFRWTQDEASLIANQSNGLANVPCTAQLTPVSSPRQTIPTSPAPHRRQSTAPPTPSRSENPALAPLSPARRRRSTTRCRASGRDLRRRGCCG